MEKEYMVALVAIEDGHPECGPFSILAANALDAIEEAFRTSLFTRPPNTAVAVQFP